MAHSTHIIYRSRAAMEADNALFDVIIPLGLPLFVGAVVAYGAYTFVERLLRDKKRMSRPVKNKVAETSAVFAGAASAILLYLPMMG